MNTKLDIVELEQLEAPASLSLDLSQLVTGLVGSAGFFGIFGDWRRGGIFF